MKKKKQTVVIVTAYGEDNYFQKKHEDIVGIYTSVENAVKGARKDGMTTGQLIYLLKINAFYHLDIAMKNNKANESYQVEFNYTTDKRKKPCVSSYMFRTYNLD